MAQKKQDNDPRIEQRIEQFVWQARNSSASERLEFTLTLHKNSPVDRFAATIAAHLGTFIEFLELTVR